MVYISSNHIHKTILTYCITKSVEIQYFSVKTSWNFTVTNPNFSYEKKYELGYIDQFSSLTEIFNCESFNGVVKEMIVRNKGCKENCELYRFCQGGCCVSRIANNSFNCEYLKELYPEIKKRVKRIISDNKNLQGYNKQFRNCVWDSISQKPDLLINMIEN